MLPLNKGGARVYELEIKTKYNEINIVVEDLESEEVKEILSQPYILEVRTKIYTGEIKKAKVLKRNANNNIRKPNN